MKKKQIIALLILVVLFLLPSGLWALPPIGCLYKPYTKTCEECKKYYSTPPPDYYCDCREAIPFRYGLDTLIADTTWFSATLDDVSRGLTAYWFADNAVTFDVFISCSQDTVTLSVTIGKNRAYNVDAEEIQSRLAQYGNVVGGVVSKLPVRIRVAPRGTTAGRAVLTPYDAGPHSVCADPLPVCWNIPYVSSDPDNVYRLSLSSAPRPMLVRWVQKNNLPARVEVTWGSCEGDVVASAVLADSSKVWLPDMELLQRAYTEKQPLFFHFYSESTGRIWFMSPFATDTHEESVSVCQGKGLLLADTTLLESTLYCDSVYMVDAETGKGTLMLNTYNLTVLPPQEVEQTLELKENAFPYLYRGQAVVTGYGDWHFLIQEQGKCDEQVLLHVVRPLAASLSSLADGLSVTPALAQAGQTLTFTGADEGTLQVFSVLGDCVLSLPLRHHATEFMLPQAGQYVVCVSTPQGVGQARIIIL